MSTFQIKVGRIICEVSVHKLDRLTEKPQTAGKKNSKPGSSERNWTADGSCDIRVVLHLKFLLSLFFIAIALASNRLRNVIHCMRIRMAFLFVFGGHDGDEVKNVIKKRKINMHAKEATCSGWRPDNLPNFANAIAQYYTYCLIDRETVITDERYRVYACTSFVTQKWVPRHAKVQQSMVYKGAYLLLICHTSYYDTPRLKAINLSP
ncbi:hypothetical protein K435DRAFT_795829 [Dendrothele bispora CBS 962.96]|uniref:Uncharacterized protein n=1 Tax=Dendrothele bispora (strain CBS 962.96) TaxID=1314807 RepID=A0A4V4HGC7_DENBC|nr:hypothetical protein K435DRAFT_795829 [Dendrothele bispora CBS 962.96]